MHPWSVISDEDSRNAFTKQTLGWNWCAELAPWRGRGWGDWPECMMCCASTLARARARVRGLTGVHDVLRQHLGEVEGEGTDRSAWCAVPAPWRGWGWGDWLKCMMCCASTLARLRLRGLTEVHDVLRQHLGEVEGEGTDRSAWCAVPAPWRGWGWGDWPECMMCCASTLARLRVRGLTWVYDVLCQHLGEVEGEGTDLSVWCAVPAPWRGWGRGDWPECMMYWASTLARLRVRGLTWVYDVLCQHLGEGEGEGTDLSVWCAAPAPWRGWGWGWGAWVYDVLHQHLGEGKVEGTDLSAWCAVPPPWRGWGLGWGDWPECMMCCATTLARVRGLTWVHDVLRQHLGEGDAHVGDPVRPERQETRQQLVRELLGRQTSVLQHVVTQLSVTTTIKSKHNSYTVVRTLTLWKLALDNSRNSIFHQILY